MINILMSRSEALVSDYAVNHISKILKKEMKVAVLGFSFFGLLNEETYFNYYGKDSEYAAKIDNNFEHYGINNINWIYYYQMSKDEMINIIKTSDVLYFPGGAPDLMISRIIEKDILNALKEFKGIVIGSSAGAMIQLNQYHISKDNEYFKFSEHFGLGYIDDFFIEVHFRRRKNQKKTMRQMRKKYLKPVYIIPDDGMIIVNDNKVTTLNSAKMYFNKYKKVK